MSTWKKALMGAASNAEDRFDRFKYRLFKRLGKMNPVQIVPYRGFGQDQVIYLKGRVLEDKGIQPSADNDTVWNNLLSMYKRFESDEIPDVRIRVRYRDDEQIVTTDSEGYFVVRMQPSNPLPANRAWHDLELELLDEVVRGQGTVTEKGQFLVPPPLSLFGIISDIDDTVLVSDATSLLKMAKLTFFNNARTRLPFEGVSAFYRALQSGPDHSLFNPIFYVSSSSWNLYDLLVDFFNVHGIPKGPLMLRDLGFDTDNFLRSSHMGHKMVQIEHILITYPNLPFILIGDSGQHDPEIYRQVVLDFPGRIQAIYIREVTTEARRAEVEKLAAELKELGVEMLLVKDTVEAALHAAERGYIDPESIPEIRASKKVDEGTETAEAILGTE
jgi:phosphatidate phosphatase APP1